MSIYLISFPPKFCPSCGYEFLWVFDNRTDFMAGASHSCPDCQTRFCCVNRRALLQTAAAVGSDLPMYEARENEGRE